jgi:hypothetical protein
VERLNRGIDEQQIISGRNERARARRPLVGVEPREVYDLLPGDGLNWQGSLLFVFE